MKQHFVPRCYLKGFSNNEEFLYTVNLKYIKQGSEKPNLKHVNDICFLKDHYNVLKEYDSSTFPFSKLDELFVEREVLGDTENKYQEIRDRLTSGLNLTIDDFAFFIDFIVQLKMRNPYYLDNTLKRNYKHWIESITQNTMKKMEEQQLFTNIPRGIKQLLVTDLMLKSISDEDFPKKMNLLSLIERKNPDNKHNKLFRDKLLSAAWIVWEIPADRNDLFITSDNPGYSFDGNNEPINTKLENDFMFCLPLTSRHYLIITDKEPQKPPTLTKYIVPWETVRVMNLYSCHVINERIIGEQKEELEELTDFLKSWPAP